MLEQQQEVSLDLMISVPVPPYVLLSQEIPLLSRQAPLEDRVRPLLRNLAGATETGYTGLWLPRPIPKSESPPMWSSALTCWADPTQLVDAVPAAVRAGPVADLDALRERPGVRVLELVSDAGEPVGAIVVGDGDDSRPAAPVPAPLLDQTRVCVALLIRERRLDDELRRQTVRADRLAEGLVQIGTELGGVLEAERRRLSGWVLAGTNRQLAEVMRRRRAFADAVHAENGQALGALREMRAAVDDLIEDFQIVVRAVYPSMLRDRGVEAALTELAAELPRRVRFVGGLGRRTGWEVESGLYHAAAATLHMLSDGSAEPLTVSFNRTGSCLRVKVADPSAQLSSPFQASLSDDARRMTALGGGLRLDVSAQGTAVAMWLPQALFRVSSSDAGLPAY